MRKSALYPSTDPGRISDYFAWGEVTHSATAIARGIDNSLPKALELNAIRLHDKMLWPLRKYIKRAVHVESWYRSAKLNAATDGAERSFHRLALAADIYTHHHTPSELVTIMTELALPYDKIIHEFGRWCHIQIAKPGRRPRLQVYTAHKVNGRTRYAKGNLQVDPATRMLA